MIPETGVARSSIQIHDASPFPVSCLEIPAIRPRQVNRGRIGLTESLSLQSRLSVATRITAVCSCRAELISGTDHHNKWNVLSSMHSQWLCGGDVQTVSSTHTEAQPSLLHAHIMEGAGARLSSMAFPHSPSGMAFNPGQSIEQMMTTPTWP
jgi:hypothetical protein